MNCKKTSVL